MLTQLLVLALSAVYSGNWLLVVTEKLFEGDPCRLPYGPGIYRKMQDCQSVMKSVQNGVTSEKMCIYEHAAPLVCCPSNDKRSAPASTTFRPTPSTTKARYGHNHYNSTISGRYNYQETTTLGPYQSEDSNRRNTNTENSWSGSTTITQRIIAPRDNTRTARRMCAEYAKAVYQSIATPVRLGGETQYVNVSVCAIEDRKLIVGGTKAEPKEFPHSAAVGYKRGSSIHWGCGGTLVSELNDFVKAQIFTSGHAQWIRVGDLNLHRTDDVAKPQDRRIAKTFAHPNYKRPAMYNDIALLKLDSPVTFDAYVRPACLDVAGHRSDGLKVVATGWGDVEYNDNTGNEDLLKVVLSVVDHGYCQRIYTDDSNRLPDGINSQTQLCAGKNGKDTCQGDSGGPIVVFNTDEHCMYDVIGVTSFGKSCGDSPGVYTRIFHYLPWIESIIW